MEVGVNGRRHPKGGVLTGQTHITQGFSNLGLNLWEIAEPFYHTFVAEMRNYILKIAMCFSFSFADLNQRFSLKDEDHITSFSMKKNSILSHYSQGRTMTEINNRDQGKASGVQIQEAASPERL